MKAAQKRRHIGSPSIDVIEESVALLRQTPLPAHLAYYLGAIPFWLGLLYFISDMSRDAYAADRLGDGSLGIALLYIWNKCWQSVHGAKMRAVLSGRPDEPWTLPRVLRMIAVQASLQPWGLIARLVAAHVILPFVWVANFFHSVTALGDGLNAEKSVVSRAWTQAKLWPAQAHGVVSIIYLFTFFVWVNVTILLGTMPWLLKTFLAVETAFSRAGLVSYLFNTTFLMATVALTSLAVDPLRRAAYAVRCFRGASLKSGDDLSAELARIQIRPALAALLIAAFALTAVPHLNAETSVETPKTADATELDRRINEVLERREFTWRAPREARKTKMEKKSLSWMGRWLDSIGNTLGRWIEGTFKAAGKLWRSIQNWLHPPSFNPPTPSGSLDWIGLGKALLVILGGILVVVLGWLGWRLWRERRPKTVLATAAATATPDLRSEDVIANQLPEDGWLSLAREHAARGELTLALRAAWLAGLAHLGHRELIAISRHKTNRDYDRELRRRARDREPMLTAFNDNLKSFERSWYGKHEVTTEKLDRFDENLDQIRKS
jgi:hypothetical protein